MRKSLIYISIFASFLFLEACKDYLQLEPFNLVPADYLFSTPAGAKTVLANIYNRMPMEDFTYLSPTGFNQHPGGGSSGDGGVWSATMTEEAIILPNSGNPGSTPVSYWDYTSVRQVNQFLATILSLKTAGKMSDADYNNYFGDAHFIRAYMYFQMARRYGGLPIIDQVQTMGVDNSALFVPRSTEKATWDFVMSEFDLAIANLPPATTTIGGVYRATKWAALALKSRAALHAASIAKYWSKAPLTGPAVDASLVGGMSLADANNYYLQAITAAKDVIDNSGKSLYKPLPADRVEAAKNYQTIFETPSTAASEIIFQKSYIDGSAASGQGHTTDFWGWPAQVTESNLYMSSRFSTCLDIVDVFEDYTDNGVGASAPVSTRTDGIENSFVSDPTTFNVNLPFKYYNNQSDIFANKDARLTASVLLPGSTFKGVVINMQGGMVNQAGKATVYTASSAPGLDGKTYYTFGSASAAAYSAFFGLGTSTCNYSSTGFALRKFCQENKSPSSATMYGSTQPWIDIRLAEVYLNYAEAAIESGQGDATLAKTYLNAIRRRAAHLDQIPATVANILKERQVEFIFEGHRYWDLIRRRDFHTRFSSGTSRNSLIPIIDLRKNPPQYLFLRAKNYNDVVATGRTFNPQSYYLSIPGVTSSGLVNNPGY